MEIVPLFDRVLLKSVEEKTTENNIYVPRDTSERSQIMTVTAVGSGIDESGQAIEMVVGVGDSVVVSKYAGTEVVNGNDKFWILKQCDILARIIWTEDSKI